MLSEGNPNKKQQEFNYLTQGECTIDQYVQEFMRLKRLSPSLLDTVKKETEKFVLGLNPKTCRMVEAFNPKTYDVEDGQGLGGTSRREKSRVNSRHRKEMPHQGQTEEIPTAIPETSIS